MTNERIQLHSPGGRLQLLASSFMLWPALAGCFVAFVIAFAHHRLAPGNLLSCIVVVPFVLLSRWVARNSTRVFATPQGLELTDRHRTVPWSAIVAAYPIPLPSLIPIYRVTFNDGTAPLTFYTWERIEHTVARFKAATPAD